MIDMRADEIIETQRNLTPEADLSDDGFAHIVDALLVKDKTITGRFLTWQNLWQHTDAGNDTWLRRCLIMTKETIKMSVTLCYNRHLQTACLLDASDHPMADPVPMKKLIMSAEDHIKTFAFRDDKTRTSLERTFAAVAKRSETNIQLHDIITIETKMSKDKEKVLKHVFDCRISIDGDLTIARVHYDPHDEEVQVVCMRPRVGNVMSPIIMTIEEIRGKSNVKKKKTNIMSTVGSLTDDQLCGLIRRLLEDMCSHVILDNNDPPVLYTHKDGSTRLLFDAINTDDGDEISCTVKFVPLDDDTIGVSMHINDGTSQTLPAMPTTIIMRGSDLDYIRVNKRTDIKPVSLPSAVLNKKDALELTRQICSWLHMELMTLHNICHEDDGNVVVRFSALHNHGRMEDMSFRVRGLGAAQGHVELYDDVVSGPQDAIVIYEFDPDTMQIQSYVSDIEAYINPTPKLTPKTYGHRRGAYGGGVEYAYRRHDTTVTKHKKPVKSAPIDFRRALDTNDIKNLIQTTLTMGQLDVLSVNKIRSRAGKGFHRSMIYECDFHGIYTDDDKVIMYCSAVLDHKVEIGMVIVDAHVNRLKARGFVDVITRRPMTRQQVMDRSHAIRIIDDRLVGVVPLSFLHTGDHMMEIECMDEANKSPFRIIMHMRPMSNNQVPYTMFQINDDDTCNDQDEMSGQLIID